jgi:hypothetical protein
MENDTQVIDPDLENQEIEVKESDDDLAELDYDQLLAKAKEERKSAQTLKAQKEHFRSKAQKLAEKNVELQPKPTQPQENLNQQGLSKDEIRLIAKGVPQDEIDYLLALQAGQKSLGKTVSLSELYDKDPAVVALRNQREAEEKKKQASLGASGKSGSGKSEPEIKSGMSREDHKKIFDKAVGNI